MTVNLLAAAMTVNALAAAMTVSVLAAAILSMCLLQQRLSVYSASLCDTAGGSSAGKPIEDSLPARVLGCKCMCIRIMAAT